MGNIGFDMFIDDDSLLYIKTNKCGIRQETRVKLVNTLSLVWGNLDTSYRRV